MDKAAFRIIDANFNRAREAARVIEEFCRFCLNCEPLTKRAKALRHQLCAAVEKLDKDSLIASRDSQADVGRAMSVDSQMRRTDLVDTFTAAAKRLTEALRAMAEMAQVVAPSLTEDFEKLRFDAYTLEKDIVCANSSKEKFSPVRLYIILTVTPNVTKDKAAALIKSCIAGGADCIQLRAKELPDRSVIEVASLLVDLCRQAGVVSIINDRVDIAAIADADGVHLGRDDLDVKQCRKLLLKPMIIGTSTHSMEELKSAIQQAPDYVSIGPVFKSPTKPDIDVVGLEYIEKALKFLNGSGIEHVAIGGITHENFQQVQARRVKRIAVSSAVIKADDIEAACRNLKNKITASD
jgi:thiamine-phosphate pyrophosphorylase